MHCLPRRGRSRPSPATHGSWLFFFPIFIGVELIYNVVLVPAVQQSASLMHLCMSPLF